jgi:putative FmdB family regulatory protein
MPIYEFYCRDCHRIFNFLSRTVNTSATPACPRCSRPRLERQVSAFAVSKGRPEPGGGDAELGDADEARVEQAIAGLAQEAEGLSEDDPRAMARLMHRFYEKSGRPLGDGMAEALRRLAAGEDPDSIEEEMGDLLDGEDPLAGEPARPLSSLRRRLRPPARDEELHEL